MKVIFIALLAFVSSSLCFSMTITTNWSEDSRKTLVLACSEEEAEVACDNLCGESTCEIEEKVCVDCVGTSIAMTYAFREMGRILHNTGEKVDAYFLVDLISSGNFVSLTSRSVYNLVERFDSRSLRSKFTSLCNDGTRYPTVFFKKLRSGKLGSVSAVHCANGTFLMNDEAVVIGDAQDLF